MKKIWIIVGIIATVTLVVGIAAYLLNQQSQPVVKNDFGFIPDGDQLLANMQKAGLAELGAEGTIEHIHQHIDIVINGQDITIPADLGIGLTFISPLHTHDTTGILHVESPVVKNFTLGQFFDEWGVVLSNNCIASYCADNTNKLVVSVNGKPIQNPHDYVLKAHDEIEIWYGPSNETVSYIRSYTFPPGL